MSVVFNAEAQSVGSLLCGSALSVFLSIEFGQDFGAVAGDDD